MGLITAILKAITAAFSVFQSERAIYNSPDLVKAQIATDKQKLIDALNVANKVLADPNATPQQHQEALRTIRLAHS